MFRTLLCLLLTAACARALEISEVLVENEGGRQDADFASPGWIEIRNETAASVPLAGWRLTDDPLVLNKWTLPAQSLAANAYLLVFASGKNRAVAGQELHTNFQMDPDGEYLALVMPNGTVAQAITVPKLRRNVSYAVTTAVATLPLIRGSDEWRWRVPVDASLDATWRDAAFNDTAWSSGAPGLGYDINGGGGGGGGTELAVDFNDRDNNNAGNTEAGFQTFVIGNSGGNAATQTNATTRTYGAFSVTVQNAGPGTVAYDDRLRPSPVNSGAFTQQSLLRDFVFATDQTSTSGLDLTITGLTAGTPYRMTIWSFDGTSANNRISDWSANGIAVAENYSFTGTAPANNDTYTFAFNTSADGTGRIAVQGRRDVTAGSHGVFLNAFKLDRVGLGSLITTNVQAAMRNVSPSLYARRAFTIPDPAAVAQLKLRVRYEDGFQAWINGQPVAARNAPASLAWNSTATADRSVTEAATTEEIIIPLAPGLLVAGTNVLAIQGLNLTAGDAEFLLTPELEYTSTLSVQPRYFATQTPAAANSTAFDGLVRDTVFSVDRGYFSAPFPTTITCPTPGAQIRYTLDGSAPTASTGIVYTAPVNIGGMAILRAAAFVSGQIPSNTDTQSYLHMATIAAQPAAPAGWPSGWGTISQGAVPANYAMDQRVVTNTAPGYGIPEALQSLPTLSLAMAPADFLGSNGIYQNPLSTGAAWERDCSIELIDPNGAEQGFHETCRVEIHGNSSRNPFRMQKHAFRLSFKGEAGAARLRYKFFPGSSLADINKLILRATFTDGWGLVSWNSARYRPDDSVMMRDVWMRRSWGDMGHLTPKSRYLHVVINGLYWGVYDAAEHMDQEFLTSNKGGIVTDWEVANDWVNPGGTAWSSMFAAASAGLSTPAAYTNIQQWLDPANFADYYLLHQYAECEDWPHHNGGAWRAVAGGKWQWLPWDQEIALQETGPSNGHTIDRISVGTPNTTAPNTPGPLWHALRNNAEWRLLVADRAHALFNNNGPLSQSVSQARWQAIAGELDKPIVAESARWGDTASETPYGGDDLGTDGGIERSRPGRPLMNPYLRANSPPILPPAPPQDWLGSVNYVTNTWLPSLHNRANTFAIITRLKNQSPTFWPATEPPVFAQHGGNVATGYDLGITAPAGAIYYTLNGTDPRTAVTGAAAGTLYSGPVDLTVTGVVKARAVTGTPGSGTEVWSALTQAQFIVGTAASAANLVISEVCYNPPLAGAWEFVELQNISAGPIDLTDVQFSAGISFTFAPGTLLAAGQRLVLARDAAAFAAKFPAAALHGTFTGGLDNSGEQIALVDANGTDIRRFTYRDDAPWPNAADGNGHSMVLIAPATNPNHALPENWRASVSPDGSPDGGDALPFAGNPNADSNGNGYSDLFDYAMAQPSAELLPGAFAVQFNLRAGADDARVIIESSTSLAAWTPAPAATLSVSAPVAGMVTVVCTPLPGEVRTFVRARVEPR